MVYQPIQTDFIHPVGFDAQGRMRQCRRIPLWEGPPLQEGINVGVNLFEPRVWEAYIPPSQPYELGPQLYPDLIASQERVWGFPLRGYWADIGTPDQYLKTHQEILNQRLRPYLLGRERDPGIWGEGEVSLHPTAQLQAPVYLGRKTQIQAHAQVGPHAVLGEEVIVGPGGIITHSVLMAGVTVPSGARVQHQIWGQGAHWKAPR